MENTSKHIDLENFDIDSIWMDSELEFRHQNENLQFRTNLKDRLTFGEVINTLFDIQKEDIHQLVINNGYLQLISENDDIWKYEFLNEHVQNGNGRDYLNNNCAGVQGNSVLTLSFNTYEKPTTKDDSIFNRDSILIVHLQYPKGIKEKSCYVQVTFCLPTPMYERPLRGMLPQSRTISLLMAFDEQNKEELDKEYELVVDSMNQKAIANRHDEFTYIESSLFYTLMYPIPSRNLFYGERSFTENRFLDAILYFEQAYFELQKMYWANQLTDELFTLMIDCAYKIGFCYQDLKLYNKAYVYLDFVARYDSSFVAQSEYINCLINLKDIRSYHYIESKIQEITAAETREADYTDFINFLTRRRCFCLVEFKQYEQAESELRKILEVDPLNDFAISELNYIHDLKSN
jgi:tetratricopeptide (TPR) repeat protein